MKMKKKLAFVLILSISALLLNLTIFPFPAGENQSENTEEPILESVTVSNVQVPVRVFKGKQPVDGLTKKDFQLYVNGQKRAINGFYQLRKKLELQEPASTGAAPPSTPAVRESRLFLMIFNLTDYRQDLESMMDYFFKHIIRSGDRLLAITNHHFFPQRVVKSPGNTKAQLLTLLEDDARRMHNHVVGFETEMRDVTYAFRSDLAHALRPMGAGGNIKQIFETYFRDFSFAMQEMKKKYLGLPLREYIKIARYIRNQPGEKWALNFFQLGRIPVIKRTSKLQQNVNLFVEPNRALRQRFHNMINKLEDADDLLVKDIGKAFLNSGATFHTMLLKPVVPSFSRDYRYKSVAVDTELILRNISHLTGGSVTLSNKITTFAKKITAKEDIVYVLSYVPDREKDTQNPQVTITIPNKKYRLTYDNQERKQLFRTAREKFNRKEPDLQIAHVSHSQGQIIIKLKNIRIANIDDRTFGAVQARIHINDTQKPPNTITSIEKTLRGIDRSGAFRVRLPSLSPGRYTIKLEFKDLFSMDEKFVGDSINIVQN